MEIELQLSNLKYSKRLEKLGCPQDSHFWWRIEIDEGEEYPEIWERDFPLRNGLKKYSAYSVPELGEKLRKAYKQMKGKILHTSSERINQLNKRVHETFEDEANDRAKLLIYLLENHLIEPKEL